MQDPICKAPPGSRSKGVDIDLRGLHALPFPLVVEICVRGEEAGRRKPGDRLAAWGPRLHGHCAGAIDDDPIVGLPIHPFGSEGGAHVAHLSLLDNVMRLYTRIKWEAEACTAYRGVTDTAIVGVDGPSIPIGGIMVLDEVPIGSTRILDLRRCRSGAIVQAISVDVLRRGEERIDLR